MTTEIETSELLHRSLPKWPSMLVVGEPVTQEQAEEIIIRTSNIDFSINDEWFRAQLHKAMASSYIGGPHGWCDWQGQIFTNSYNIGKWPSTQEVYEEWRCIATAFPFLSLKCQLFDGETCEEEERELKPIIQFNVSQGQVTLCEPEGLPYNPSSLGTQGVHTAIMFTLYGIGERGCTIEQFKHALETTLKARERIS